MKRKLTWAAILIAAAAGLLVLVYTWRGVLIVPHLTALIRETVREHLGLDVSIGPVAGSLLADLEIRDLQTVTPAVEGPVSSLTLKRLGLRYSLMSLLQGFSGFVQAASLEVEGLRVSVDLGRGHDSPSENPIFAFLPPRLPALSIRDADVSIRADEFNLDLRGVRLETGKESPEGQPIQLQVAECSWSHPRIRPGSGSLAAHLRLTADAVHITEMLLNGEPLVEQAHLAFTPVAGRFPFAARLRVGGGHLELLGEFTDSVLQSTLTAKEIQLAPVADLFNLEGRGILSLDADVTLPFADPEGISGCLDLTVRGGSFRGVHDGRLRLDSALNDGWLRVSTLELNALRSHVAITGAAVRWSNVLTGRTGRRLGSGICKRVFHPPERTHPLRPICASSCPI